MSRPVILITTGRNVYSLRAYDAVRLTCERLNIQYDLGHVENERLSAPQVQALIRNPLCRTIHKVKSDLIYQYRKLSKFAAQRDIRPDVDKMFADVSPRLLKTNARFVAALKAAPWIYTGHGIFSKPFVDQRDPRLIQYNQLSLLQWPAKHLGSPNRKANFVMVERGGILGESRMATDMLYLPRVLSKHLETQQGVLERALTIRDDIKNNRYTEHSPTSKVPIVNKSKSVFVPLHCDWDAQMIRFSPFFGRNQDFLQFVIDNVPSDCTVVVKKHPKSHDGLIGKTDPVVNRFKSNPRVVFTDANIHDIFDTVSAVVTLNSSVGLEAIIHGLPVVVLGRAFYAHIPEVTYPAVSLDHAKELLGSVLDLTAHQSWSLVAIDYFWDKYLVPIHPAGLFEGRVRTLVNACTNPKSSQCEPAG